MNDLLTIANVLVNFDKQHITSKRFPCIPSYSSVVLQTPWRNVALKFSTTSLLALCRTVNSDNAYGFIDKDLIL